MQSRNYRAVADIVNQVNSKGARFGMSIQAFTMITPALVSVVAAVSEVDEEKINETLLEDTDGTVAVVPKSVRPVENPKQTTARFFAVANTKIQAFTDEVREKLTQINANVYADEENEAIWRLSGEGDEQYLIQESSDNLEEIFKSRRNRRLQSSQQGDGKVAYASGDFAAYASETGTVRTGFLYETADGLRVCDYDRKAQVEIRPEQIVCSADITDEEEEIDLEELQANISTRQGTEILNYFRKLYGSNPSFFNKLTQLVRNHDGKVQLHDTNPDVNEMLQRVVR